MEKLWHVQRLKDGTYGDWREFKENKEGVKMRTFIVRDSRTGKDRKVKGSDIPMPSVMLRVGGHINSEEFIVKIIEKEVNKMKYFELKVVKVKKEKKFGYAGSIYCKDCKKYIKYNFPYHFCVESRDNYINGENIDKIKFPCFCRFGYGGKLGILLTGVDDDGKDIFELHRINNQISEYNCTRMNHQRDLKGLIKDNHIHILKGKIIIYEEE